MIAGDLEAVAKVVRALRAPTRHLRFVYEAGPCGFGIHRDLEGEGGVVVNPSSMPKRSGDRIKTDRRGVSLARLHRGVELTVIDLPTADDEAPRDLVRAREDAAAEEHRVVARFPGVRRRRLMTGRRAGSSGRVWQSEGVRDWRPVKGRPTY